MARAMLGPLALMLLAGLAVLLGVVGVMDAWLAAAISVAVAMSASTWVVVSRLREAQNELTRVRRATRRVGARTQTIEEMVRRIDARQPLQPQEAFAGDQRIAAVGLGASFYYRFEANHRQVERLADEFDVVHPLWDLEDKLKAFCFADRHGIPRPHVYGVYDSAAALPWDEMPDEFVLKPRRGASNQGVLALVREPGGTWWDVMRSRSWTVAAIEDYLVELSAAGTESRTVFAEELVRSNRTSDSVPWDYKALCLDGSVAMVLQRDVHQAADRSADWRFQFWDRDFQSLGPIKYPDRFDATLSPPEKPEELVDLAERVARLAGLPLLRVDFFESDRGFLLGELTPLPGHAQIYTAAADAWMGDLWERAETQRLADEIRAGRWDHLRVSDDEVAALSLHKPADAGAA